MTNAEIKLTERIKLLEKQLKELKATDTITVPKERTPTVDLKPLMVAFRAYTRVQLRIRGFSKKQAVDLINAINDYTLSNYITEHGPAFLKCFMAILPKFVGEPANRPVDNLIDLYEDSNLKAYVD